ncbi:hypothetical protein BDW42DRAFT_159877 [Aspergillus taichungensis]|uniref:Uncharacterized protein n=1 Tax=Aspergillus taichungensis TaxID=482145 RepID=A0A2J5I7Q1_9EURO|nr:hypothetical protein BDW42DRAFT_159877 [Aspergillus taichungensis]
MLFHPVLLPDNLHHQFLARNPKVDSTAFGPRPFGIDWHPSTGYFVKTTIKFTLVLPFHWFWLCNHLIIFSLGLSVSIGEL